MDKMVEIARFQYPAEAQTLIALLKSEGIDCYLRDEISSQLMAGYADIGGARLEILDSDLPRALEVMEEGGYLQEEETDGEESGQIETIAGWARHIPLLRNYSLERQIMIFFALIAVLLALFIYVGSLLSSK